jgi:diguanylate cyclase (GGDEF)-like protein
MTLKVLVVESETEEVLFLHDVLREVEDEGWLREWTSIETQHAATWAEAIEKLSVPPSLSHSDGLPHVILLNPDLSDSQGAGTFRRLQSIAPDVPVILTISSADQSLGDKLMREGAQDFLFRKQIDCGPLSHAIRNAVHRHRLLTAARAATMIDALTGLPNYALFTLRGNRDRKLAERMNHRWMLLILEPRNLDELLEVHGDQRRDLALVEAADHLRSIACPSDAAARIGNNSFAITVFDSELETLEEAWIRIRSAAAERRLDVGASIFDPSRPLTLEAMVAQARQDLTPSKPQEPQSRTRIAGAA